MFSELDVYISSIWCGERFGSRLNSKFAPAFFIANAEKLRAAAKLSQHTRPSSDEHTHTLPTHITQLTHTLTHIPFEFVKPKQNTIDRRDMSVCVCVFTCVSVCASMRSTCECVRACVCVVWTSMHSAIASLPVCVYFSVTSEPIAQSVGQWNICILHTNTHPRELAAAGSRNKSVAVPSHPTHNTIRARFIFPATAAAVFRECTVLSRSR